MKEDNDISILISGSPHSGKSLAALVITKALSDSGFSDVKMVTETGKPIPPINVVPSILDIVKKGAPDLFQTRVTIQEVKLTRTTSPKKNRLVEPELVAEEEG